MGGFSMKIFISTDMEGATGIVHPAQVTSGNAEYDLGCRMQIHDLRAAADGALEGGCEEILAADSHSRMINMEIAKLESNLKLVSGSVRKFGMVEGIESCDGAFFVAYHAMAGTEKAVMDHTIATVVHSVILNGRPAGEISLNAAVCSHYGIPVALVTGDLAACREAEVFLGRVVTVPVKSGRSQFSAILEHPSKTRREICLGAKEAARLLAKGELEPPSFELPYCLEITFHKTSQCDAAAVMPSSERKGARTVSFTGNNFLDMRRQASVAIDLAETAPEWN
jgi:D-amino peptidase